MDKIASKLDDMRRKAPPVSEIVKERLGIKVEPKTSGTPETSETKPGFNMPSPEAIAKEKARRGLK